MVIQLKSFIFQFFNLILIIVLLIVPVIITILLLRHFGRSGTTPQGEEFLIAKVKELEERIEELENRY